MYYMQLELELLTLSKAGQSQQRKLRREGPACKSMTWATNLRRDSLA